MDHLVYKEIFIDRIYDNFIFYALKKNYEKNLPLRIFDIGANLGFFTIRCCEIWKQMGKHRGLDFLIFEPSENCIHRLKKNLKSFENEAFTFDIRKKLIGKKSGSDWFVEDKDHHLGQCVSAKIEKFGHRYSRKIEYEDLSKDLKCGKIDLLKCDIEGSEVDFIKNYSSFFDNITSVIIETHGRSANDFVNEKMKDAGFVKFHDDSTITDSAFFNLFFIKS